MRPMRENIVVAMTGDGLIGSAAGLPWHLPDELCHFRQLTWGGTLVLGRRTFESIGRALPGRRTVVVSTTLAAQPEIIVCRDFAAAVAEALRHPEPIFYAGGRTIYQQALLRAEALLVSWLRERYHGDIYFPEWDRDFWCETGCEEYPDFVFCHYRRR